MKGISPGTLMAAGNGAHTVGAEEAILCAWHDCDHRGLLLYKAVVEYGSRPEIYSYRVTHLFCCYRHRQYWVNGHVSYGNLPSGDGRGRLL